MGFFNKVLASVGIGSAKVDTKLVRGAFTHGDAVEGVVEITGGTVEQTIDTIRVSLVTNYTVESNDRKHTESAVILNHLVSDGLVIEPKGFKSIPFSFTLPYSTPITEHKSKVWVHTELGIPHTLNPKDSDYISVAPSKLMTVVLDSVEELGFRLREVENEYSHRGNLSFIQEFEFYPVSGRFRGKLDELELVFSNVTDGSLDIHMQVDRKVRGISSLISEKLGLDETLVRLTITSSDYGLIRSKLENLISQHA